MAGVYGEETREGSTRQPGKMSAAACLYDELTEKGKLRMATEPRVATQLRLRS